MTAYLERARALLELIVDEHQYREVPLRRRTDAIDFSSNDYLGLSTDTQVIQALRHATRVGSGGARLLGGRDRELSLLEEELAAWLGRERVLLFSSGYTAALGAITTLAQTVDEIASDELNHACLIDGIRLSGLPRTIYPHARYDAGGAGARLVVTESIFSMDGDSIDIAGLLAQLGPRDVLLVDEAHALGVVGSEGAGLAREIDDPRLLVMGTLSKSFGSMGGFVAGPAVAVDLLVNRARSFIYDTALPPALALAARVALTIIRKAEDRRATLRDNVTHLREGLHYLGLPAIDTPSPVVPVVLGSEERTLRIADQLLAKRIEAPAIRPPTVPDGASRLRFSLRSNLSREQVDVAVGELSRCIGTL